MIKVDHKEKLLPVVQEMKFLHGGLIEGNLMAQLGVFLVYWR